MHITKQIAAVIQAHQEMR